MRVTSIMDDLMDDSHITNTLDAQTMLHQLVTLGNYDTL